MIKIENKIKKLSADYFAEFKYVKTLIKYDFPLLVLMHSPDDENWLFNWYGNDENHEEEEIEEGTNVTEQWMAFQVSDTRLQDFESNHISLREVILLAEYDFYLLDTIDFPKPIKIKKMNPTSLPKDHLPKFDITLNGKIIKLTDKILDPDRFNLSVHLISNRVIVGEIPLFVSGPVEDTFQKYIKWSAHKIENRDSSEIFNEPYDWTTINEFKTEAGSFVMLWSCPDKNIEKIKILRESCEILRDILNCSDGFEIKEYVDKIGYISINNLISLLQLVIDYEFSIDLKWLGDNNEEQYLVISEKIAERNLRKLEKYMKSLPSNVLLKIELKTDEIEMLRKEIKGTGGFQNLYKELQNRIDGNILSLDPFLVRKVLKYAQTYGEGGYQIGLRAVVKAIRRMGVGFSYIR